MGMVTVIVINNDHLHRIREMGEFGKIVADSAALWPFESERAEQPLRLRSLGYCVSCEHADAEQYLLIHRQNTRPLTYEEIQDIEAGRRRRERKAAKAAKEKA